MLPRPAASCEGVVLRTWPCGETSVIASLLTRDHGYVKVIAKAARRPSSRLRALVEPGRVVSVEFSLDPARELQYLRGGAVERDPLGPGASLEQSIFMQGALELIDRCRPRAEAGDGRPDHGSAVELFEICDGFIRMLSSPSCARPDLAFFAFEWQLLARHGMAPEVDGCAACGAATDGGPGALWFSPAEGGVLCGDCARRDGGGAGKPLGARALAVFRAMAGGGIDVGAEADFDRALRREVGAHLHNFLGYHLPGYRLPAALELLRARKEKDSAR
ncbi:recombination protein O N-terminal domain-containing protein [bacterium]|nr:recombination protein O N-terminal domain-containing protein [bacterium]